MPRKNHPHYKHLKTKWLQRHKRIHRTLWNKHSESLLWLQEASKQIVGGSMAAILILMSPTVVSTFSQVVSPDKKVVDEVDKKAQLKAYLSSFLPNTVQPLTVKQEKDVAKILSEYFSLSVTEELEGKRLNRSYGLIGAEQHLARYPGDSVESHDFIGSGMAPGLGAYGYFAKSPDTLSDKDIAREKYYIAVQTFLAPGWHDDPKAYYTFFRYRKMMVVNPENGKAMVTDIADAGPAEFTGKHLGGSPEVMAYLERKDGSERGPVLYFFIDDPGDTIPLGPITMH